jgi:hypothetical protein
MRSHQPLRRVLDGQRFNRRPIRSDAAEHGGKSHVNRVTPGAEADVTIGMAVPDGSKKYQLSPR